MTRHKFTFGLYRGQLVEDICKLNPRYCLWADSNVRYFHLSPRERAIANREEAKIAERQEANRIMSYYNESEIILS